MTRGRRPTIVIDIELALRLHAEHGEWKAAVDAYNAIRGTSWTMMAVYHAVWSVHGRRGRKPAIDSDRTLGMVWTPARPRPLRVIPDYRKNIATKVR